MQKTILITGASSGIVLSTAVELARRGERVFASMRDLSRAATLLQTAADAGVRVELVQLDVTDQESIRRAVRDVMSEAGAIDVVVNNAGMIAVGPLEFASDEAIKAIFDTNTFGPLRLIQAVLPAMRDRGEGRIVNLTSGASHARMGHRLLGLYSASKAALTTLTEELLKEVAPLGIKVVLIDGALRANTRMALDIREQAARLDPSASPYALAERILQVQWPARAPAADETAETAGFVADACLLDDPPFIYPPERQDWLRAAMEMTDDTFLRLCRLELTPELYEGAPAFWPANRIVAAEL